MGKVYWILISNPCSKASLNFVENKIIIVIMINKTCLQISFQSGHYSVKTCLIFLAYMVMYKIKHTNFLQEVSGQWAYTVWDRCKTVSRCKVVENTPCFSLYGTGIGNILFEIHSTENSFWIQKLFSVKNSNRWLMYMRNDVDRRRNNAV